MFSVENFLDFALTASRQKKKMACQAHIQLMTHVNRSREVKVKRQLLREVEIFYIN